MNETSDTKPRIVHLSCDNNHIIHRKGERDYPIIRKLSLLADDADKYEIVDAGIADAAEARNIRLAELEAYDSSDAVNIFYLDGEPMWLDKATRVGLVNSVNATELIGGYSITFWYGTMAYALPLDLARQLLAALEVYALECFNTTARHRAALEAMTASAAIETYDITAGYPAPPQFTTSETL